MHRLGKCSTACVALALSQAQLGGVDWLRGSRRRGNRTYSRSQLLALGSQLVVHGDVNSGGGEPVHIHSLLPLSLVVLVLFIVIVAGNVVVQQPATPPAPHLNGVLPLIVAFCIARVLQEGSGRRSVTR